MLMYKQHKSITKLLEVFYLQQINVPSIHQGIADNPPELSLQFENKTFEMNNESHS